MNACLRSRLYFMVGIACFLFHGLCIAQPILRRGLTFPLFPSERTWFENTKTHAIYHFENEEWKHIWNCYEVSVHGQAVVARLSHIYCVAFPKGDTRDLSQMPYFKDSIVVLYRGSDIEITDPDGDCIARVWLSLANPALDTVIVRGVEGYCVPACNDYVWRMGTKLFHTWGVLGTDGQWLIQPDFDDRFHFKNGIADVIYYGQKRKINEKGEFVE